MSTTKKIYALNRRSQGGLETFLFWREFRTLLRQCLSILPQKRTQGIAERLLLGMIACPERTTITGSILYNGFDQVDWSPFYRIFNRSEWDQTRLFDPILEDCTKEFKENEPIVIAMDDTSVRKTGTKIPQGRYGYDALAPKFVERPFMWCLRFLHCSVILRDAGRRPVPITVVFDLAPPAPKAMRQSPDWNRLQREASLPMRANRAIHRLRECLDQHQMTQRKVLLVVDGSFTNRNVVDVLPHDVALIGRVRLDAKLYEPLRVKEGKRIYGDQLLTPDKLRCDPRIPIRTTRLRYGGRIRDIRYKEHGPVLWKMGTHGRPMRLIIVMPIPFRLPGKKMGYNKPAYLLTTDLSSPIEPLIQAYLDRWQIEVLHREQKTMLGLGQAQTFSEAANEKVHTALAAAFAVLMLASHKAFHGKFTPRFPKLAKWRRQPMRITAHALITLVRNELARMRFIQPWDDAPDGWVIDRHESIYTP